MARLAVNVDHVATLRQARGIDEPDPVLAAGIAELAGAEGIICHLREDRRHVNDRDVKCLRETVKTKLNLEMAGVREMLDIAVDIRPDMATLVPERRRELTTEGGLNVTGQVEHYTRAAEELKDAGIAVSFFVDPSDAQIESARRCGADIVEIHTGHYAEARSDAEAAQRFARIQAAVGRAAALGLGVSVGHGLNYVNVKGFGSLTQVAEYSIGHSIVSRAVFVGFERAVREMVDLVKDF